MEHSGSDENEHSREEMKKLIEEKVIRKTLQEIILKNSQPDLSSNGEQTYLFIQPLSKFIVSGVQGDADGREAHHL